MSYSRPTEAEREQKRQNLKEGMEEIYEIEDDGHEVMRFTDYHWRIDGMDVWPSAKKFMKRRIVRTYDHLKDIFTA